MSRTTGLQYDGEKEVEAYEYGLEQRKNGNGQDLDLLIEATDYLDSIGEIYVDKLKVNDIIREKSKGNVSPITDKAIEKVPLIIINNFAEKQSVFIQNQHKALLKYARDYNESKEVAFVFNEDLSGKSVFIGSNDSLDFGNGLFGKGKNLFIMHNHPRNSSFSAKDIIFILENENVKSFSVVKSNGDVEVLLKSKSFDKEKLKQIFKRQCKKYIKNNTDAEFERAIREFLNRSKEYLVWIKN
ncbi:MAG: hypothetical protein IJD97_10435 [Clostridia bacterium]|nr:hypothetical protein [Clostridia bacterium]